MTDVAALAYCLAKRDPDGRRTTVPVFGNGLNVQAFDEAGAGHTDPWTTALDVLVDQLPSSTRRRISRLPRCHQGVFDEFDVCFADPGEPAETPSTFLTLLGRELDRQISRGKACTLYHHVGAAEFRNILTTCIDDTFPTAISATRRKPPGVFYDSELYRKSVFRLGHRSRPTDIWQMNGSASQPSGVRLGCLGQAETIVDLERQRVLLMNAWRTPSGELLPPAAFAREKGPLAFNWFKHFMVPPLVFIGASLDLSDWSMWWLLHQRARVQSVFEPEHRSPTLALTSAERPCPHLAGQPAGVEQIVFPTFNELWATYLGMLTP